MIFDKKVILENNNIKVTVVEDIETKSCSIGVSMDGRKPSFKFISKELYDMLIEELMN